MDDRHFDLLKKISDKLTWALIFLFIIMLNTCSLSDDIEDAIRDRGDSAPAATPEAPTEG
ncbi:hypothetical protein [Brevundimonas sp.]|uniref:hypothetical protein n=1 Tax=Brevundimonas sp. TaxID=1871086 RepID=UPI0025F57C0A|nr:hypothetical protein [Brevundimonas sp.]